MIRFLFLAKMITALELNKPRAEPCIAAAVNRKVLFYLKRKHRNRREKLNHVFNINKEVLD
jgi:hypothetical protein